MASKLLSLATCKWENFSQQSFTFSICNRHVFSS
jgi:hypothetical protein